MGPARVPESPLSGAGSSGRPLQGQLSGFLTVWRPLSRGGLPLPGPLRGGPQWPFRRQQRGRIRPSVG